MKRTILILGAGRSSIFLIEYLLLHAEKLHIKLIVADTDFKAAQSKLNQHPCGEALAFNINDQEKLAQLIQSVSLVISLLPAFEHVKIARICLEFGKNLLTASYASAEMKALNAEAIKKGVTIMMECGLDPGIDHMSALKVIHQLKNEGAEITGFESYCGGLISKNCDNNPFHYKISWAPQNVILAGQGGNSVYRKESNLVSIPYSELFTHTTKITIPNFGTLEAYPNRDSLLYESIYGLEGIPNLMRGTLRYPDFCKIWQQLVKLNYTNNRWDISTIEPKTFLQLTKMLTNEGIDTSSLANHLDIAINSKEIDALLWLGILESSPYPNFIKTPAQALQFLAENKLKLTENDKDLVVMHHVFNYELEGKKYTKTSSLLLEGNSFTHTAMAKTVGLPLAMIAKKILSHMKLDFGVQLPINPQLYLPILNELEKEGVRFLER